MNNCRKQNFEQGSKAQQRNINAITTVSGRGYSSCEFDYD